MNTLHKGDDDDDDDDDDDNNNNNNLSGFSTAVAVFRKPNAILLCFSTDLLLNFLLSWPLVLLPSTFFLAVLFSFNNNNNDTLCM